jgi:cyclin B
MKISNFPLQNINNKEKENKSSLYVIKEEKENVSVIRKSMINLNDANAITKGAVNKNKIKEDKIEVKDYFHSLVDDYGDDIFRYLMKNEKLNVCDYSNKDLYKLQDKKYYNEKNRSILLHWLVKNNNKWKLKDDTIFMAMNIMDRYISKYESKNSEFQLIAIASYFIASKYEDIYPPYLDELSQICNYVYSNDDIIRKEYEILVGLNFDILYNSSYKYLTFLHSVSDKDNLKLLYLAQFILEISLDNIDILEYSQSKRALAALLIAKKILQIKKSWNNLRLFYNYDESEIKNVQKKMIVLLNKVIKSKTKNAIYEKFESSKYKSVSSLLDNLCNSNKKERNDEENKENNVKYNDENKNDNF